MLTIIPLQTLEHLAQQSERIALADPHGWKISVVSIVVILFTLCVLFVCYLLIGKIVRRFEKIQTAASPDIPAVDKADDKPHDLESYKLTINRKEVPTLPTDYSNIARLIPSDDQHEEKVNESGNARTAHIQGIVQSPLPGIITDLKVQVGDKVSPGQIIAKLEAMKMDNSIEAEYSGTVTEVYVSKGDSVLEGTSLMKIQ